MHYPQTSRLVRATCREFNVLYLEYASMTEAFYSHVQYVQSMGKPVASVTSAA